MANDKHHKDIMSTERYRRSKFLIVLAFAATVSLAPVAQATALNLDTGTDSSTSMDGTVNVENGDSSAALDTDAGADTASEINVSGNDAVLSNSTQVDADTDVATSLTEPELSENGEEENDNGSETEGETSAEAGISSNVAAPGLSEDNEAGFFTQLLLRSNALAMMAEPVELEEGDVEVQTASEGEANFESDFTYYVVRHGLDYDSAIYREPARLGGNNAELGSSTTGAFWFGVSAPDEDGIQSEINHQGKVLLYLETEDGWKSLEAQFNGEGELQHVNGVSPVEVE